MQACRWPQTSATKISVCRKPLNTAPEPKVRATAICGLRSRRPRENMIRALRKTRSGTPNSSLPKQVIFRADPLSPSRSRARRQRSPLPREASSGAWFSPWRRQAPCRLVLCPHSRPRSTERGWRWSRLETSSWKPPTSRKPTNPWTIKRCGCQGSVKLASKAFLRTAVASRPHSRRSVTIPLELCRPAPR